MIVCPRCKKEYDVHFNVLGKRVTCKSCKTPFEAKVLRARTRKPEQRNPMKIILALTGAGLLIIVAMIFSISGEGEPEKKPPPVEQDTSNETVHTDEYKPLEVVRTERELFCLDFLQAVSDNDVDAILKMFNFGVYHRLHKAGGEPRWNDFDEVSQLLKKKDYTQAMTNDSAQGGGFVRSSEVVHVKESSWDNEKGQVDVRLKNTHNGRLQDRSYQISRIGNDLVIFDYTVGPEYGGDLDKPEDKPKTLDEKYKHRVNPLGEIVEQEYTPDTDKDTVYRLEMLTEDLLGDSRNASREARESLIDLGKKSIPAVLNKMVGLDMKSEEDIAVANKCVSVLRVLTGRSFRFQPGMFLDSMLESQATDLTRSIQRWFGWWDRNKDTWEGRDIEEEMEDW